jgi:serine/threonine protein kinase
MNLKKLVGLEILNFTFAQKFDETFKLQDTISEYSPPEVLKILEKLQYKHLLKGKDRENVPIQLKELQQIWSTDVWSLAVIVIEIITGVPVWLKIPCKVVLPNGKSVSYKGVLKVNDRNSPIQILEA